MSRRATLAASITSALRPDRKVRVILRGDRSRGAYARAVLADGLELESQTGGERGFVAFAACDFIVVPTAEPETTGRK